MTLTIEERITLGLKVDGQISEQLQIPIEIVRFQDTYHPLHFMCRVREAYMSIGCKQEFSKELNQYADLYESLMNKLRKQHGENYDNTR